MVKVSMAEDAPHVVRVTIEGGTPEENLQAAYLAVCWSFANDLHCLHRSIQPTCRVLIVYKGHRIKWL